MRERSRRAGGGQPDGERWRLGRLRFVDGLVRHDPASRLGPHDVAVTTVYLGNAQGTIAEIQVGIPLRDDASVAIEALRDMGLTVVIASGDSGTAMAAAARSLDIRRGIATHPDDKTAWCRIADEGHRVFVGSAHQRWPRARRRGCVLRDGRGPGDCAPASDLPLAAD
jgi:cation transport ATPase